MNKNMIAESGNAWNMFFKNRIHRQICIYCLGFFFILQTDVWAQDSVLTLNKAIELTLSNNFDVKITEIDKERNKNNDQAGNAGMLPRLDLNGSYTKSNLNTHQSYSSGQEVNRDNVSSENLNANAVLTWTIFDGMKMFATRIKLGELYFQSDEKLKIQMENTLQELITEYFTIVQQKQLLKSTNEEINFAEERIRIAERKLANGSGSKLDYLQTKADLNALRSAQLNQQSALESAKIRLNQLMVKDQTGAFDVEDSIVISYRPNPEDLKTSAFKTNHLLKYFEKNQRISELSLSEIKATRLPKISLNGTYQFSKVNNEVGLILLNQNTGFNYGITATLPLFNGFTLSSQVKNARLNVRESQLLLDQTRQGLTADLYNAYREFSHNMTILQLEEENILYAQQILHIAQEKYRVGSSNLLDVKNAQATFESSVNRLVNARFAAKISETVLRKLNGDLIH